MKLFFSICFFFLLILNAQPGFSQKDIEISDVKYLLHTVSKGETVYSLCLKYKVTQNELKAANPDLTAVLKTGSTVKIPIKKEIAEKKPVQAEIKTVATEPEYYYHKVNKKQTIFSIARQYGITANELIRYNPEITNGLVAGQVLKIPVQKAESSDLTGQQVSGTENGKLSSNSQPGVEFKFHTVLAGETLYSLEQKFSVSHEEMIRLNPILQDGLKTGTRLQIPVSKTQPVLIPKYSSTSGLPDAMQKFDTLAVGDTIAKVEPVICSPITGRNTQTYKVGLLLPFYLQGNDHVNASDLHSGIIYSKIDQSKLSRQLHSGSIDSVSLTSGIKIDPRAESFLEFYDGVLLAIDSLQKKGMNIELYTFDVTNQKMINALLQTELFRDLNLIIGPVYPEFQESVASFAAKNRIPMVSPLASTGNFEDNNPYYFKVNPTREYQIEQTAKYIADEFSNKNFVLLPMNGSPNSAEAKLAELGKAKLLAVRQSSNNRENLYHEYSFQKQGLNSLKPLLDETGENIFLIPTDNEAQVSVAVTNLNAIAENYDVVLIGTANMPKLKSIQTENYHHIRLRYLSPTFIDYSSPLVRRFISHYRSTFSSEPSQFSHQGFDVAYYFLNALYLYGKDFRGCLAGNQMELTQLKFSFRRVSPMGGFMNNGLFVTAWERNYDIKNYGIVGVSTSE